MFYLKHSNKIKNYIIYTWQTSLIHLAEKMQWLTVSPEFVALLIFKIYYTFYSSVCHLGVTWMLEQCKIPYSIQEVRKMTSSCTMCAEINFFYKTISGRLMNATAPFKRALTSRAHYLLLWGITICSWWILKTSFCIFLSRYEF